ncbi:glycosyltransferase family 2 protein [Acidimangrovimonas sediminis]|uniref:glycosyltransferase family 2 protein n=1 Tax=Acidimangrovimonas sediminis TaxID=2056283 RepID=UPI000C7FDE15|nr:glycosyltransferase [Acidimangrovimonas sediminis]
MSAPRFTIVVPCYNAAATLAATLESFRRQSFADWECLLVDDGSTDATPALIAGAAAADPRFRALANPGKGPSTARNLAIGAARGEILAFCDADDLWLPGKLDLAHRTMAASEVAGCFGRIAFFDGARSTATSTVRAGDLTVAQLLGENPVCTLSNLCVRREVFARTGGFDPAIVHNEDLDWLIRLVGAGHRVVGLDTLVVMYRTSVGGLSSDLSAMRRGRAAALASAARFGHRPLPRDEAIHLRYLARRALRVGAPAREALSLALGGLLTSPRGFLSPARRGVPTLAAALSAPLMPARLRRRLFSS